MPKTLYFEPVPKKVSFALVENYYPTGLFFVFCFFGRTAYCKKQSSPYWNITKSGILCLVLMAKAFMAS